MRVFYLMFSMDAQVQLKKQIGKAMSVPLFDILNGCSKVTISAGVIISYRVIIGLSHENRLSNT